MGWDGSRGPTNPKYDSPRHRAYKYRMKQEFRRLGAMTCTAVECVMQTRVITNPNGNDPDGLTAGHADDGVNYDGPQHRACNLRDGSKRARAKQSRSTSWQL